MTVQFFQTRMGRQFYEHSVPEFVGQLERLNRLLERLVVVQRQDNSDADA